MGLMKKQMATWALPIREKDINIWVNKLITYKIKILCDCYDD